MCLAIPGKIVELIREEMDGPGNMDGRGNWAIVDVVGLRRRIDISLVSCDGAAPGDWVLIHVGFAMSKISEAAAVEQMQMLQMLGETAAALEEVGGYGGAAYPPDVWPGSPPS